MSDEDKPNAHNDLYQLPNKFRIDFEKTIIHGYSRNNDIILHDTIIALIIAFLHINYIRTPTFKKKYIHWIIGNNEYLSRKGIQLWIKNKILLLKLLWNKDFISISNQNRLKKEMCESSCIINSIESTGMKYNIPNILNNSGKDSVFIDICSGKGWFNVINSHYFPESINIAIDKDKNLNLSHLKSCDNITFYKLDIRPTKKFRLANWIKNIYSELCIQYNNKHLKLYLVGIHLCGELSKFVIDCFNELNGICIGLFLVPCCYPKRNKNKWNIIIESNKLNMDPYLYWIQLLEQEIISHKMVDVDVVQMLDMDSPKNSLIRCVRKNLI